MNYKRPPLKLIPQDIVFNNENILQKILDDYETPCYVYDMNKIKNNWVQLNNALPSNSVLCYSIKANPNKEILKELNKIGSRFEASSINEIRNLLNVGISSVKIIYVAPAKSIKDITHAIKLKIKFIVVDSHAELLRIEQVSSSLCCETNVLFRLNDGCRSRGSLTMTGRTQFGMSVEDIVNSCFLISEKEITHCRFLGLHNYNSTNILDVNILADYLDKTLEVFKEITEKTSLHPTYLDVGGGFGSPLFEGETSLDIDELKNSFNNVIAKYSSFLANSTLIFESGRYIVGDSGIFITNVNDVKCLHDKKYALLNAGINNYGGFSIKGGFRHPPIKVFPEKDAKIEDVVTLCGPLCTPIDIIASDILLPKISFGDYIIIFNAGAYQYSTSPGYFLGFGFPNEIAFYPDNNMDSYNISFAQVNKTKEIVSFFEKYLSDSIPDVLSKEFYCIDGITAAIKKNSVVVAYRNDILVAAFRFYRLKDGNISLYQFTVSEDWRGQNLFKKMLKFLGDKTITTKYPKNDNFNNYFQKSGWKLYKQTEEFNYWEISF